MLETHGLAQKRAAVRKFSDEQRLLFHGARRSTMQFTFVGISKTQAWT